jgi:hypothetical protein
MDSSVSLIQLGGAFCFGAIIGWYIYIINRHHQNGMQLTHLVALIGVIGGGAILALFPASTDLFGAYGIGLGVGFIYSFLFNRVR